MEDRATFDKVHRWGFAYFDGPLEGLEAKAIQAEDAERLQRALRHAREIQPASEWAAWLEKRLEQLGKGTIWQSLLAVAEMGVQEAEKALGASDPAIAGLLDGQATLLQEIARYEDAEPLFRRALAIDEASYGNDHPDVARVLNNLAMLLKDTNRLAEAEPLMRRALAIHEASYCNDHPNVASDLNNLALLLHATNRQTEAETLSGLAARIFLASLGMDHPDTQIAMGNYLKILRAQSLPEIEIEAKLAALEHPG